MSDKIKSLKEVSEEIGDKIGKKKSINTRMDIMFIIQEHIKNLN